ncbi:MAG: EamA family transporter [Frankiales bacterium]|nr:EamA family transporter [Frankiales bacterium]
MVYVVWGSTYLAIAFAIDTMPPMVALGTRFAAAAAAMAAYLLVRRGPRGLRVERRELGGAVVIGVLLLGVGMGVLSLAERVVPTGIAALIVAVVPLYIALLRALTGDRPPWITWVGIAIGLVGIGLLVLPGNHADGGSDLAAQRTLWSLLMLGGTFAWALGTFLQPRIRVPRDPLVLSTYEMLTGAVVLTGLGLLRGERVSDMAHASAASWWGWIYLVTIGSLVAFTAYVWVAGHAPVSLVATYAYVNPVVAVLLGWWLRGESLSLGLLVGAAVVVAGVALVVSAERIAGRRAEADLLVDPCQAER